MSEEFGTLQEYMTGQVLEVDNPFYHRVVKGEGIEWAGPDTVELNDLHGALPHRAADGTIELIVKAGWSVEFQATVPHWNTFGILPLETEDELAATNNWRTENSGLGGDSKASFVLRAGSSLAVTTGDITKEMGGHLNRMNVQNIFGSAAEVIIIRFTTEDASIDWAGRTISFDAAAFAGETEVGNADFKLEMIAVNRTGTAAGEGLSSEESEQVEQPEVEPKIIGQGVGYIVRVGFVGESWVVYVNGVSISAFETESEALNEAYAAIEREKKKEHVDPDNYTVEGDLNAVKVMFSGFLLGLPYAAGIVLIGFAVNWMVRKVITND